MQSWKNSPALNGRSTSFIAPRNGKTIKRLIIVHGKSRSTLATKAVTSGVEALDLDQFVTEISSSNGLGSLAFVRRIGYA
jgi:hypothetical protein